MRLSTLFGRTLREAPADAEHRAYQLILRAGLVRPLQAGSFALLPLGMRALRRIEAIMHEELARIGGQELRTPVVQSAAPWQQTGRYGLYGPLILSATDRNERTLIVAPTHEEAVAELARREIGSYRQLPALVYQIHTKYRDELRARAGLMRMREFTMLDAYSLDADHAGLDESFDLIATAFERIFTRCGVSFVAVEAATGEMGGRAAREYMALSTMGEDTVVLCDACGYAANIEIAAARTDAPAGDASAPMAEVATPDCTTIAELAAFLSIPASATAKAVFFDTPERGLIFAVIRGDLEVNEAKLGAAAQVSALTPASVEQITAIGAVPGYASPVGLRSVTVIADESVVAAGPLVAGANRVGYHTRNVVYGRDWQALRVADITTARAGDPCIRCGRPLRHERALELGHIFKLGSRYTEALGAVYLDQGGTPQPIIMGSYGIGLERLLQVLVEQHNDDAGIVWPLAVAPLDAQLIRLGRSAAVAEAADSLYTALREAGVAVLYDDRDETAGVKFNDADLIGLPVRLVVSERLIGRGNAEVRPRGGAAEEVSQAEVVALVRGMIGAT